MVLDTDNTEYAAILHPGHGWYPRTMASLPQKIGCPCGLHCCHSRNGLCVAYCTELAEGAGLSFPSEQSPSLLTGFSRKLHHLFIYSSKFIHIVLNSQRHNKVCMKKSHSLSLCTPWSLQPLGNPSSSLCILPAFSFADIMTKNQWFYCKLTIYNCIHLWSTVTFWFMNTMWDN